MTERQAWLLLAKEFSKPRDRKKDRRGLFSTIDWLPSVAKQFMRHWIGGAGATASILAPYTDAGDKVRVRFCLRMAKQLERKKRGKGRRKR